MRLTVHGHGVAPRLGADAVQMTTNVQLLELLVVTQGVVEPHEDGSPSFQEGGEAYEDGKSGREYHDLSHQGDHMADAGCSYRLDYSLY